MQQDLNSAAKFFIDCFQHLFAPLFMIPLFVSISHRSSKALYAAILIKSLLKTCRNLTLLFGRSGPLLRFFIALMSGVSHKEENCTIESSEEQEGTGAHSKCQ